MGYAEVTVKTAITVNLSDFSTRDLIIELEDRGHQVDNSDLTSASVAELIDELLQRDCKDIVALDLWRIIKALQRIGCPKQIVHDLEEWNKQPIPTLTKLRKWEELCQVS